LDPVSPALPRPFPSPLSASIAAAAFAVALALLGLLVVLALVSIRLERSSRRRRLASLAEVAQQARPNLIVVLGCPPRTRQGQPSRYLQGRVSAAAAAFHHLGGVPILCSGRPAPAEGDATRSEAGLGVDLAHADDEVAALRRGLEAARIPSASILEDRGAARTIDTIDHLSRHHASDRILIVTQPFHLPRALYLARVRGLEAWGFTAPGPIPGWRGELREGLGRLRAHFDVAFGRSGR
jgi:SanA protein